MPAADGTPVYYQYTNQHVLLSAYVPLMVHPCTIGVLINMSYYLPTSDGTQVYYQCTIQHCCTIRLPQVVHQCTISVLINMLYYLPTSGGTPVVLLMYLSMGRTIWLASRKDIPVPSPLKTYRQIFQNLKELFQTPKTNLSLLKMCSRQFS